MREKQRKKQETRRVKIPKVIIVSIDSMVVFYLGSLYNKPEAMNSIKNLLLLFIAALINSMAFILYEDYGK